MNKLKFQKNLAFHKELYLKAIELHNKYNFTDMDFVLNMYMFSVDFLEVLFNGLEDDDDKKQFVEHFKNSIGSYLVPYIEILK